MRGGLAVAFVAQVGRIAIPYVLAALGGTFSERAGVINIALEGLLLAGAFGAVAGTLATGSSTIGVASGIGAALLLAAVHAYATLRLRADQIVSGVAVTLLAGGLTRFLLKLAWGSASNSPRLATTPSSSLAMATVALVVLAHIVLFRTRAGLRLRVAGERPEALQAIGLSVAARRWGGVLASGALAGLGGVWLAFDQHGFVAGMSAGRGFIALAAMIVGGWRPIPATIACLVFATVEAIGLRVEGGGALLQVLPHLVTVVVLAVFARGAVAPRALGRS